MEFTIYVKRLGWRRFQVAVFMLDAENERYVMKDQVLCIRHKSALRYGERQADAYFLDQTKRSRSMAIVFLRQPDEKIRIVGDDDPESQR